MLNKEDSIGCEIRKTKTGDKVTFEIYLCKRCNCKMIKAPGKWKIATGYCKKCYYLAKIENSKPIGDTHNCKKCKQDLKLSNFDISEKGNIRHICKKCNSLHNKYKIITSDYNNLKNIQNNKCKICHKEESDNRSGQLNKKDLSVDHCHKTGKIRGLLCGKCNKALGGFEDNVETLESAIQYLKNQN